MTTETDTSGFCIVCGRPYAQINAYTDERGNDKFVHDACYEAYARRLLFQAVKVKEYDDDD